LTQLINQPIHTVFNYLANGENLAEWSSIIKKAQKKSDDSSTLGAEYYITRELASGQIENVIKIIEYEECNKLALSTISGPNHFYLEFNLEAIGEGRPINQGTGLSMIVKQESRGINILKCFTGFEKDLHRLKELLE